MPHRWFRQLRLFSVIIVLAIPPAKGQTTADPAQTAPVNGRVVSAKGDPVVGAAVTGQGFQLTLNTTTDADGRFTLKVPTKAGDSRRGMTLLATADGDRLAYRQLSYNAKELNAAKPIELKLGPAKKLFVRVVDGDNKPIADARVGVQAGYRRLLTQPTGADGAATLLLPPDTKPQSIFAEKAGVGFDYLLVTTHRQQNFAPQWFERGEAELRLADAGPVTVDLRDRSGEPIVGAPLHVWLISKPSQPDSFNNGGASQVLAATSDEQGRAVFSAIPKQQQHPLTIWQTGSSRQSKEEFIRRRITVPLKNIGGEPVVATLERPVPVRGRVVGPDGEPISGVTITGSGNGYEDDSFRGTAFSDQRGDFEIRAYPDELLMLVAGNKEWAAPAIDGLITKPGEPIQGLEFRLQKATRVFGRVTVAGAEKDEPIAGTYVSLNQKGRSLQDIEGELPKPAKANQRNRWIGSSHYRGVQSDKDGRYEFFVGPGEYTLSGPSQVEPIKFTVTDQSQIEHNLRSERPESGEATIRVVTGEPPHPVAGARVTGIYRSNRARHWFQPGETNKQGEFRAERRLHLLALEATSADKRLRGSAELADDADQITITLNPTATATGRLVDPLFGEPMAGEVIKFGTRVYIGPDDNSPWQTAWGGSVTTDAEGRFNADNLIPGREYEFDLTNRHPDGSTRSWSDLGRRTPKPGESVALGDVTLKRQRSIDKLIQDELRSKRSATDRFLRKLDSYNVKEKDWPLIIVYLDDDRAIAEQWFRLQHVTPTTRDRLAGCEVLLVGTASQGAFKLAKTMKLPLFTTPRPIVVCQHADGVLAVLTGDEFSEDGKLNAQRLADFLDEHLSDKYGT